jgi:hypothetical protein
MNTSIPTGTEVARPFLPAITRSRDDVFIPGWTPSSRGARIAPLSLNEMVHRKLQAAGFVGLGEDLPQLWLERLARGAVATYRCHVPAQEMSALFRGTCHDSPELSWVWNLTKEMALSHKLAAGVVGRLHLQELRLRDRQVGAPTIG